MSFEKKALVGGTLIDGTWVNEGRIGGALEFDGVDDYVDLGDSINFEQSMQRFYTTANSRVANDQTAFAKFCYGDMPSCKEGDGLQCVKDNHRWINY